MPRLYLARHSRTHTVLLVLGCCRGTASELKGRHGQKLLTSERFTALCLCTLLLSRLSSTSRALSATPALTPHPVHRTLYTPNPQADTTLHLSDAASAKDVTARLDVHSARLVVRLYDASRVKPCLAGRNLAAAARRLTDRDFADDVAKSDRLTREVVEAEVEPDVIDKAAAKAREWAHAVLVNTCIATRHLQEHAVAAGEWLQGKAKTA